MKAIRVHEFGGSEVLRLEEVAAPRAGPGQVVVRLRACGVNPVDTYIRAGFHATKPPLPYTPGMDGAGVVEGVGEEVNTLKVGERVYVAGAVSGTYAEQTLCEASRVHPLPEQISFAQGAGVNVPYATAYRALFHRAQARPGETILIHGATGGVGIAATQLASAAGLRVIGTGGTEEGRRLAQAEGARHVLDHRAPDYLSEVLTLTGGRGVDVILEMLANVNLDRDLDVLAKHGRVVVIGNRGRVEIDPRKAMTRDASIHGMMLMNVTESAALSIHAALGAGLENGTLRPIVSRELPLAQAAEAHRAVLEPGALGKIVLLT
ncbi:MAG: NADPH:quinone reductase [Pyrinomonadaceae bacterium]|nr:NADPH:quinone reductase [Pyrinomonadaceae bacterium]